MVIAHRLYKRELLLIPQLVADVAAHDRRRAAFLRSHYDLITRDLHRHHVYEDEHFWPAMAEREPESAQLARRMRGHHDRLAVLITAATGQWDEFVADPNPDTSAPLVATLTDLGQLVRTHMDQEESEMLPVLERNLTEAEWDAFSHHMSKDVSPSHLVRIGTIVADQSTPQELSDILRTLPMPLQWVYKLTTLLGRRYVRKVYLGPVPPVPPV